MWRSPYHRQRYHHRRRTAPTLCPLRMRQCTQTPPTPIVSCGLKKRSPRFAPNSPNSNPNSSPSKSSSSSLRLCALFPFSTKRLHTCAAPRTSTRCCVLRKVIQLYGVALRYSPGILLSLPVPTAPMKRWNRTCSIDYHSCKFAQGGSETLPIESEAGRLQRKDRSNDGFPTRCFRDAMTVAQSQSFAASNPAHVVRAEMENQR